MTQQHLLLVDGDPKSLRVMETSLKNEGYTVSTAANGQEALQKIAGTPPNLIISEVKLAEIDGFELCRRLKADQLTKSIPFIFVTAQTAVEHKLAGIELGAQDYLTKPLYIKEFVAQVKAVLAKQPEDHSGITGASDAAFSGNLRTMGVIDLVRTLETGRKTGAVHLRLAHDAQGHIYLHQGKVVDAEYGRWVGESAFWRLIDFSEGSFQLDWEGCDRPERISCSTQALVMEGARRLQARRNLLEQLPSLNAVLIFNAARPDGQPAKTVRGQESVQSLFDGKRTLEQVINDADLDELETLSILQELFFEGIIRDSSASTTASSAARRTPTMPAVVHYFSAPEKPEEDDADQDTDSPASEKRRTPSLTLDELNSLLQAGSVSPGRGPIFGGAAALSTVIVADEVFLAGKPSSSQLPASPSPTGTPVPEVEITSVRSFVRESPPSAKSIPWRSLGLALAILAMLGAGGYAVLSGNNPPPQVSLPEPLPPTNMLPSAAPASAPHFASVVDQGAITPSKQKNEKVARVGAPAADHKKAAPESKANADAQPLAENKNEAKTAVAEEASDYRQLIQAARKNIAGNRSHAAMADFRQALRVRPDGAEAQVGLGLLLVDVSPQEAIPYLEKGLVKLPRHARGHVALGTAYQISNRESDAAKEYEKYLALEPDGGLAGEVRIILQGLRKDK